MEIQNAMKTKQITLKGWVNKSYLMLSENTTNEIFALNFKQKKDELLANGYKKLQSWELLRDKKASEKIIIKGWYWRGAWSDATKETCAVFYK